MRFSIVMPFVVALVGCATIDTHKTPSDGLEELRYEIGRQAHTAKYNGVANVWQEVPTNDVVLVMAITQMRSQVPQSNSFTCRYLHASSVYKKFSGRCVYYLYNKPMAVLVDSTLLQGERMAPYL